MHIPHSTPLGSLLVISYRNHQKSLAYFSHLTPLVYCSCLLIGRVKKGGGMAQWPRVGKTRVSDSTRVGLESHFLVTRTRLESLLFFRK